MGVRVTRDGSTRRARVHPDAKHLLESLAPVPVVCGYIRSTAERPGYLATCRTVLATWCSREGWELRTIFTDVCSGLDVEDRLGFNGLLNALEAPDVRGLVVVDGGHLSHRVEVVAALVRKVVLRDKGLRVMDGGLPPEVQRVLFDRLPWA